MKKLQIVLAIILLSFSTTADVVKADSRKKETIKKESKNEKKLDVVNLDPYVVTASKVETSAINTPADVTVISEKKVHKVGAKSPMEALNDSPGFNFHPRRDGGMFSHFQIRGLYSNSTSGGSMLILLDGIPQRRLSFGGPYIGGLPFDAVERIELVKGAMGSLYGRNALAGAMQLFTDPGSEKFQAKFSTTGEAVVNGVKGMGKLSGPIWDFGTFSLTGTLQTSKGHVNDSSQKKGDIYLHTEFDPTVNDNIKFIFGFVDLDEDRVAPHWLTDDGERHDLFERDRNYTVPGITYGKLREYRLGASYTHKFPHNVSLGYKASWWKGETTWSGGRIGNRPSEGTTDKRTSKYSTYDENVFFNELDISWKFRVNKNFIGFIALGGSYEYLDWDLEQAYMTTEELYEQTGSYSSGVPIDMSDPVNPDPFTIVKGPSSGRTTYEHNGGGFLRTGFSIIERIHLEAGVRLDGFKRTQETDTDSASHNDKAVSPGVGLSIALLNREDHKLNIYGNWGMGFSPVFRAVNNSRIADVDPEHSMSGEGGVKWNLWSGIFEGKALFYQLDRTDVVGWRKDPDHPDELQVRNVGDWRIRGVEFETKIRPYKDWFVVYGSFTWRDTEIVKNEFNTDREGNDIPMVSPFALTVGVRADVPSGFMAGVEYRWYSKHFADEENVIELSSYGILDIDAGWRIPVGKENGFTISGFMRNGLDADYVSGVGGDGTGAYGWYAMPRTFGLKLAADLK